MRTLPRNATDQHIKALVVEWSELLARKEYARALEMFLVCDETDWTPSELEAWIVNYGSPEPISGEPQHELTSLLALADADDIIENKIQVDRVSLYGLDPAQYLGMVHYYDVPLDGERSDLTARFHIRKVGEEQMALEFLDIHVM